MGLNIPPDLNQVSQLPGHVPREHEFDIADNEVFNGLAGWEGRQQCPGGAAAHIDQVWVSRAGMQVETYRVTATRRTSRASDHNPLTTILERR